MTLEIFQAAFRRAKAEGREVGVVIGDSVLLLRDPIIRDGTIEADAEEGGEKIHVIIPISKVDYIFFY